jgi:hypothetical protein
MGFHANIRTAALLSIAPALFAQPATETAKPQEAVGAILKLFDSYRVVMIGEVHLCIQQHDLFKALVESPDFAGRVNDIVIESANSLYQPTLDHYIAGESVAPRDLEKVWQNFLGAPGGTPVAPYHGLLTAIRARNQALPPDKRIRVLAGDPPIDWDRVQTRDDIAPFLGFRDEHFASVIRYEVLAKRRKALIIIGAGHIERHAGKPGLIEQQLLTAFVKSYVITPGMSLFLDQPLDARFGTWPAPSVLEMKGTWVGEQPSVNLRTHAAEGTWSQTADAYLYLGPREALTQGGEAFDLEGTPYGTELRRRWKILFDKPPAELPKSDGKVSPLFPAH